MNSIIPYKIISYILLFFAFIFTLSGLLVLMFALASPVLLFTFLLIAFIVTYIISSFIFLQRGIIAGKKLKPRLERNIRRTAYVVLFFAVMNLFQIISGLYHPAAINESIDQMLNLQKNSLHTATPYSPDLFHKVVKITMYIMAFGAATMLIHVYETFKFLKQYAHLFSEEQQL